MSFCHLKMRLRSPQIKMAQALASLSGCLASVSMYTPAAGGDVAVEWVQALTGPLQVSHWDRCLLNRKQIPLVHWGHELSHLHHSIEGATGVAPTTWWCFCSWGAPTLGRIRGHQQGTATVCGVFQICQGGLCRGQWMIQVPGQCTFNTTFPWGWQAGLHGFKGIVICGRAEGCQK